MTDWEEYEHVDARDAKRRVPPEDLDPEKAWRARIRKTVLDSLYPRSAVDKYWFEEEAEIIPSYIAARLRLEMSDVRRALTELVREGYLRGPLQLPKRHEDGSAISYDLSPGRSLYDSKMTVEWGGTQWVEALHRWGGWRTIHKPNGKIWRNPPKKLIERALRKAMAVRKPVPFDGRGFETLCARDPFRSYGYDNGLFKDRPNRPRSTEPEPDICRRCGTEVKWKSRFGKRRRDHGLNKCNMAMVRKIMED